MSMTFVLDGATYARMLTGGAQILRANRSAVNDLNVFPIPDGDTGDNMYMTVASGAAIETQGNLSEVSAAAAHGMLLGAHGNSGVILSRIFAGVADGFSGVSEADLQSVAGAWEKGVSRAYGAVAKPVEGTILTVLRESVAYANGRLHENESIGEYFSDLIDEGKRSLARTPDLFDVLKEAGVVDSGGAGFLYVLDGMKRALNGESFAESADVSSVPKALDLSGFTADSELTYGYCTEFLLQLQNAKTDVAHFDIDAFRSYLESVGESVVAFAEGSVVKVHVHTKTPGEILNDCQKYGEFLTLKIENMTLQHHESVFYGEPAKKPRKRCGIVTAAMGEGIKETFTAIGADAIVDGGQSMNPSVEDFLRAFDRVNAETIYVLPNNGNMILTARQAAELYEGASVFVIPTKTIGEGYAALSMMDVDADPDDVVKGAAEAIDGVLTGEISRATKDTVSGGVTVHQGDYIGFVGDTIYVSEKDKCDAAEELSAALDAGSRDVILVIAGADVTDEEAAACVGRLEKRFRRSEVILINGGQPIYDFIIIYE